MRDDRKRLEIVEMYLEDWKDIPEIASEDYRINHNDVRNVLEEKGLEVETLEKAVERRIKMAFHRGLDRKSAERFVRPRITPSHNKKTYGEEIERGGIYDRDEILEKTESYLDPSEVNETAAAYWLLKKENLGVKPDDLVRFFNEGLDYNRAENKPSTTDEVIAFLESEGMENDENWFKLRDEYILPSFSEYAESKIGRVEEYVLGKVYQELTG